MFRKATVSYMLAVTIAQGVAPVLPAFASTTAAAATLAAGKEAGAAPVVVPMVVPVQATQLSRAEMDRVEGAGFFSWLKVFSTILTAVAAIVGAIVKIWETLKKSSTSAPSGVEGGETLERRENERYDYASQADYDAGQVQSYSTQVTQDWQQTEVWYGSGGCGGGEQQHNQMYMEQQEMSTC